MPSTVFANASSALTSTQVAQLIEDLNRGENLGFIDPASSTLKSQNAADYFYNTADGNALYRATAADQAIAAFTKVSVDGGGTIIGEATTFATLPGVQNGKYALLTKDDVGTGTADAPQYKSGVYKGIGGVWAKQLTSSSSVQTVELTDTQSNDGTDTTFGTRPERHGLR